MIIDNLKLAKVIDNNDSEKLGRVKVLIYDVDDVDESESNLKWAYSARFKNDIPENDDIVWVRIMDQQMRKIYYGAKLSFKNLNNFSEFDDNLKSKILGWNSSYPDVKFEVLQNGNCIAMSSTSGEIAILNSSGSYVFLKDSGEIILSSTKIELNGNTNYAVKYNEMKIAFDTLRTELNTFVTLYNSHTHQIVPPGVPGTPTAVPNSPGIPALADMSLSQNLTVLF